MARRPQIEIILADITDARGFGVGPGAIERRVFSCFDTRAAELHPAAITERERVSS
jgi:hypothetical protein